MYGIYVCNSHGFVWEELTESQRMDHFEMRALDEADLVVYAVPPWPDPQAPETLRSLPLSALRRIFLFHQHDDPVPWAPGVYPSIEGPRRLPGTHGGFYINHHRRGTSVAIVVADHSAAEHLWSFVGTARNAAVRSTLIRLMDDRSLLVDTQDWDQRLRWESHSSSRVNALRTYVDSLPRSKFVVCPRGQGPSSMRIFEAMEAARCPVVIADAWTPPPFVKWPECSIRVRESDVARVPDILREREDEAEALGNVARSEWELWFSPHRRLNFIAECWLDLYEAGELTAMSRARRALRSPAGTNARRTIRRRLGIRRPSSWRLSIRGSTR